MSVAFCTHEYIPVAQNWLAALDRLGLGATAKVISLDEATRSAIGEDRVLHRPFAGVERGFAGLWRHRMEVLRALVADGVSVVHSDADAVWVQDPFAEIDACEAEIVFSQGTFWPTDVHSARGLVLCCGFFYLRAGSQALALLDGVLSKMERVKDDQVALNRMLARWLGPWDIIEPYQIPFQNTQFTASRQPIRGRGLDKEGRPIEVAILPHHAFPRQVDAVTEEVVVAHPLSGKTCADKEQVLRQYGLWVL